MTLFKTFSLVLWQKRTALFSFHNCTQHAVQKGASFENGSLVGLVTLCFFVSVFFFTLIRTLMGLFMGAANVVRSCFVRVWEELQHKGAKQCGCVIY